MEAIREYEEREIAYDIDENSEEGEFTWCPIVSTIGGYELNTIFEFDQNVDWWKVVGQKTYSRKSDPFGFV